LEEEEGRLELRETATMGTVTVKGEGSLMGMA
jgi:hypothetical protein